MWDYDDLRLVGSSNLHVSIVATPERPLQTHHTLPVSRRHGALTLCHHRQVTVTGFWLNCYFRDHGEKVPGHVAEVLGMYASGQLTIKAGTRYSLEQFGDAVVESVSKGKPGKVFFEP